MSASVNKLPAAAVRSRATKNSGVTSIPCRYSSCGCGPSGADTIDWEKPVRSVADRSCFASSPDSTAPFVTVPPVRAVPAPPAAAPAESARDAEPSFVASACPEVADVAGMTSTCTAPAVPAGPADAAGAPAVPVADFAMPVGSGSSPSRNPVGLDR